MVEKDSAVIDGAEQLGLEKRHSELQRVGSRDDATYKALLFWTHQQLQKASAKSRIESQGVLLE